MTQIASRKKPETSETKDAKKRFDDTLRRMLSTPPKPHVKQEKKKTGNSRFSLIKITTSLF